MSQQDPKAILKLSTLFAVLSILIGIPYYFCSNCPTGTFDQISNYNTIVSNPLYIALSSSIIGAIVTLIFYKSFNESEKSLRRRLARVDVKKEVKVDGTPTRVWLDGCFDLCHLGHWNAFRQAKQIGDVLVVGINPDVEVLRYKGPPVYTQEERYVMVKACKWVDEVVEEVPYVLSEEYITNEVLNKDRFNCDIICHGDDPCLTPNGDDVFATAKKRGVYREYKRTEGVSTTDYIGRMLSLSKTHHNKPLPAAATTTTSNIDETDDDESNEQQQLQQLMAPTGISTTSFQRTTTFMPSAHRLTQFAAPHKKPTPDQLVVYCCGTWDIFNAAHVDFLRSVHEHGKSLGQSYYLILGLYSDNVANKLHGENYPILNLNERVLSVLSCRYIDDVVIGAPYNVTQEFIINFNIAKIFHGTINDTRPHLQAKLRHPDSLLLLDKPTSLEQESISPTSPTSPTPSSSSSSLDPYAYPRSKGMVIELKSPRDTTTKSIIQRVIAQKQAFEAKFERKSKSEAEYVSNKTHVQEL